MKSERWGRMSRIIRARFGKETGEVIPGLIKQFKSVHAVSGELCVAPGSVRYWLLSNDWYFDHTTKAWVAPKEEVTE